MKSPDEFVQALYTRRDTWLLDAESRKAGLNNQRRIGHDVVAGADGALEHRVTVLWGFDHQAGQGHSYDYALAYALELAGVGEDGVQR